MQRVSVIIPTYNYARYIGVAIESLLAQTYPVSEIIVVDDGSTDETELVVKRFKDRVCYIKKENGGVCSARNIGIKKATGDFVAFFDADDIFHPTKIEKQIAKFHEDPQVGLVHCQFREFDSEGNTIRYALEGSEGWVADDILLMKPVIIGPGGTTMVRRDVFAEVGFFDERLEIYEDWEFCYRVARKFKIGFVREALLDYRFHGENSGLNLEKLERSVLLAYKKAFDTKDEHILRLRRECYGNLYKILAGSHFKAGNYGNFSAYLLRSLWLKPSSIWYYFEFPLRRFGKRQASKSI